MMPSNRSLHRTLLAVVALQGLILLSLWVGGPRMPAAQAQGIPDAGAQNQQIIDELKAGNAKLDRITTLLSGGEIEVKLKKPADAGKDR